MADEFATATWHRPCRQLLGPPELPVHLGVQPREVLPAPGAGTPVALGYRGGVVPVERSTGVRGPERMRVPGRSDRVRGPERMRVPGRFRQGSGARRRS